MKFRKVIISLLVFLLFNLSCMQLMQKYFYNSMLPNMILERIDNYYNLNDEQKIYLKKEIRLIHSWHRKNHLSLYRKDILLFKKKLLLGIKKSDVDWLMRQVRKYRTELFHRVIPVATKLVFSLSIKQIKYMKKVLDEENTELSKSIKYHRHKGYTERIEKIIDKVEFFTGNFSKIQKQKIISEVKKLPDTLPFWLQYRKDQQGKFYNFLLQKPNKNKVKVKLLEIMVYQEKNLPTRFKVRFQKSLNRFNLMIYKILSSLNNKQKEKFQEKLEELSETLLEIERS